MGWREPVEPVISWTCLTYVVLMRRLFLGLVASAVLQASQASANPLKIGFDVQSVFTNPNYISRAFWLDRATAEGAGIIRINVFWSQVAPSTRPAGFDPSDPSSPGYNWEVADTAVRNVAAGHIQVLITLLGAPTWAEGPGKPAHATPGTWRPNASQYADFARAAAIRYSGRFPDPRNPGSFLPRVRYWQAWNEPNLPIDLAPQWVRAGRGYIAESPIIYRRLLNAFYGAIKAVSPANFVVTAGTAPYGDPPGGGRMQPVEFDRVLFCLRNDSGLTPLRCPDPPRLDALAHHPYGINGPLWHAVNPDDVAPADMYKLARVQRAARHWRHVLPAGRKKLWVTETSWDSNPPDPGGVPVQRQARFVEQTMYVLWRQGVDTILWFEIVDAPPIPSYVYSIQGGMYFISGKPKPAAQALRFPLVTRRLDGRHIEAWGRAPQGGPLTIEMRHGRGWTALRTLGLRGRQFFWTTLPVSGRAVLRAQMRGQTSLTWTQAG